MRVCRHCCFKFACRPRGLCWTCYYTPGIREAYPSTSKFATLGVGIFNGRNNLPATPTAARPGTDAKIVVLAARAKQGVSLWHPLDAVEAD